MTKTEIVRQLMEITHEITTEIEKEAESQRSYNADEVMDLLNYFPFFFALSLQNNGKMMCEFSRK